MRKVLFVGAHPDDVIIGIGGMVLHHLRKNDQVTELIMSKGTNNILNAAMPKKKIAKIRVAEEFKADKILGKFKTEFFDFVDHKVKNDISARSKISRALKKYSPEIIYVPAPKGNFTWYSPDHTRTGKAVTQVVKENNLPIQLRYYMTTRITKLQGLSKKDEDLIEKAMFEYKSQLFEVNMYLNLRRFYLKKWGKALKKPYAEGWQDASIY